MTSSTVEIDARSRFPELRWQKEYVIWRGPLMENGREAHKAAESAKPRFEPCVTDEGAPAFAVETLDGSVEVCELAIPASDWHRDMGPFRRYDLSPIQFAERVRREMTPESVADPRWIGSIEIAGQQIWRYLTDEEEAANRVAAATLHRRCAPSTKEVRGHSSEPWLPIVEVEGSPRQVRDAGGFAVSCTTEAEAWRHAAQALESAAIRVEAHDLSEPIIRTTVAVVPAAESE